MPNNVIIVTNCGTDSHDYELLFKAYSVFPENLNEMHFKHMVLQRGYEIAEETFKHSSGHDNFMYAEDSEQGYTVLKSTFYIDEQIVIWYEEGEMETIHYYGESHECWVKPEEGWDVIADPYNEEEQGEDYGAEVDGAEYSGEARQ